MKLDSASFKEAYIEGLEQRLSVDHHYMIENLSKAHEHLGLVAYFIELASGNAAWAVPAAKLLLVAGNPPAEALCVPADMEANLKEILELIKEHTREISELAGLAK